MHRDTRQQLAVDSYEPLCPWYCIMCYLNTASFLQSVVEMREMSLLLAQFLESLVGPSSVDISNKYVSRMQARREDGKGK